MCYNRRILGTKRREQYSLLKLTKDIKWLVGSRLRVASAAQPLLRAFAASLDIEPNVGGTFQPP